MQTVPTSPAIKPGSYVLWDAWFNSGMKQLQTADAIRFTDPRIEYDEDQWKKVRRACNEASDWFRQAIQQAQSFAGNEHRLCISKSGLAWGCYWQEEFEQARACATEALACLNVDQQRQPNRPASEAAHRTLASARCNYILGDISYGEGQYLVAIQYFSSSMAAFRLLNISNPDVADAIYLLSEALWNTGRFQEAIAQIQQAETALPATPVWDSVHAHLLSRSADWLMLDGQYREASLRYTRWIRFAFKLTVENCDVCKQDVEEFAAQAIIFARAFIMLGDLVRADDCLTKAQKILEFVADPSPDLLVSLATQRAAWLRWKGLIKQARDTIACVDQMKISNSLVDVRAWLIRAEIEFDAGQYAAADRCFAEAEKRLNNTTGTQFAERIQIWLGLSRVDTVQSLLLGAAEKSGNAFRELEASGRVAQPECASALHDLAMSLLRDNKSDESWPLAERAVDMLKASLGPKHPALVTMLNTQAEVAWVLGGFNDPESLGSTGFDLCDQVQQLIESDYPSRLFDLARSSSIQARLLHFKKCTRQAEAEFRCSLMQWECAERMLEAPHPEKSWTILALASLYAGTERPAEAETLYEAVACLMLEMKLTKDAMAYEFNRLGNLYYESSLFCEAEWLYSHAVALYQAHFGSSHPHTQQAQANLAKASERIHKK